MAYTGGLYDDGQCSYGPMWVMSHPDSETELRAEAGRSDGYANLYRLYLGLADGMSIARVPACRYSK